MLENLLRPPITNLSDLQRSIASLPKPSPGFIRVYRGQTHRSDSMLPTSARGHAQPPMSIWGAYCANLSLTIAAQMGMDETLIPPAGASVPRSWLRLPWQRKPVETPVKKVPTLEGMEVLHFMAFGFQALAQHYGPGSPFLDVTHSLDIALWFALHTLERHDAVMAPANPLALLKSPAQIKYETLTTYRPHRESPGWLYVFNVMPWGRGRLPRAGELIDLQDQDIPRALQASLRVRRQQACLLCGGAVEDPHDLMQFAAGDPIPVTWPLQDASGLNLTVEDLFPNPALDPWYDAFLRIPKAPAFEPRRGVVERRRPLEVAIYGESGKEDARKILEGLREIEDVAHHPSLSSLSIPESKLPTTWSQDVRARMCAHRLGAATRILGEGPLMPTTPPPDSGSWKFDVMTAGIADTIETTAFLTGAPGGPITTNSVLLQLSPLEVPGWRLAGRGAQLQLPTCLWLVRSEKKYVLHVFEQGFPETKIHVQQPVCFQFDAATKNFQIWYQQQWLPATGRGDFDLFLLTILTILYQISPGWTESPVIQRPFRQGQPWPNAAQDAIQAFGKLRLVRVRGKSSNGDWHILRKPGSEDPYAVFNLAIIEAPS